MSEDNQKKSKQFTDFLIKYFYCCEYNASSKTVHDLLNFHLPQWKMTQPIYNVATTSLQRLDVSPTL